MFVYSNNFHWDSLLFCFDRCPSIWGCNVWKWEANTKQRWSKRWLESTFDSPAPYTTTISKMKRQRPWECPLHQYFHVLKLAELLAPVWSVGRLSECWRWTGISAIVAHFAEKLLRNKRLRAWMCAYVIGVRVYMSTNDCFICMYARTYVCV